MKQQIYHNVHGISRLVSILNNGFLYKDIRFIDPCVCMTRNRTYLSDRGIRMVFDYQKLKHNYRIKPFCLKGWNKLHSRKFIPKIDEMEERVYNDVDINKTCIRIDIDVN